MGTVSYDHELRAIGQGLESQGISSFELRTRSGSYVVSGAAEKPESLMVALRRWRSNRWRHPPRMLNYSARDILMLEQKGRARRATPNQLPDFYSVSNILRTLGAYLDARNARLIEIQKRPLTITLVYETPGGHPEIEDRTIVSFYKTFMELHGRRARTHQPEDRGSSRNS